MDRPAVLNNAPLLTVQHVSKQFPGVQALRDVSLELFDSAAAELPLVVAKRCRFILEENQSTYIPIGEKHRLANPGKIPAFLIEVQSGAYLNEDDIVRYDDIYRRSSNE